MKRLMLFSTAVLWISFFVPTSNVYGLNDSVYIWQRNWTPEVGQSIKALKGHIGDLTILSGNITYSSNKLSVSEVNVNWVELSSSRNAITIAFRLNTHIKELLRDGQLDRVLQAIEMLTKEHVQRAKEAGVDIVGIQLDYDCPTSKLKDYTELIKETKKQLGEHKISITALPTWLGSWEFKELVKATDYYVLQLHSFEAPKTINDKRQIFLKDKALDYVKKANRVKHPFAITLPTYGYEVGFDNGGKFLGLRAESEPIFWKDKAQVVREYSSPGELLKFIGALKKESLRNLKEICWFRMPVKGDEFNWDIKTLLAVVDGRAPRRRINTILKDKGNGLYEVFLENTGDENVFDLVFFNVEWDLKQDFYYDISAPYKGAFSIESKGLFVKGPAPKVDQSILVGWFRSSGEDKKVQPIVSKAVFYEK